MESLTDQMEKKVFFQGSKEKSLPIKKKAKKQGIKVY